jgi:integrase
MPCHHALANALRAYAEADGITGNRKGLLFRTSLSRRSDALSELPIRQTDAWRMIRCRAGQARIAAPVSCHTFRATGITAYLVNGGTLEHAQTMAAHESPLTTKLYDRARDRLTSEEVERIGI